MSKFKVGDMVVCDAVPKDKNSSPGWSNSMDRLIGKPMRITDFRGIWLDAEGWTWREEWLRHEPIMDDIIRVGDTVEVLINDPICSGHKAGDRFIVTNIHGTSDVVYSCVNRDGVSVGVYHKHIKKVKAGGPIPTNKQPSNDEQVPVESQGKRNGRGEGCPVGARRPAGRTVPPVPDLGHATRGKERRARVAAPEVQLPAGCKSHR